MILNKSQILAAKDLRIETVPVPEWADGDTEATVCVRNLRGWERDKFEGWASNATDLTHYRAKFASLVLCDESGESLGFTEADVLELSKKSAAPLERIREKAAPLSGMGRQDLEAIEKNSAGQNGDSGSN